MAEKNTYKAHLVSLKGDCTHCLQNVSVAHSATGGLTGGIVHMLMAGASATARGEQPGIVSGLPAVSALAHSA